MSKPKLRLRGFEGEWETRKIGDLTSIVTGATPSTAIASYWDNGTIRWMSSGELNNKYIYDVKGRITEDGYHNSGTHLIPPDCVLIGLAGQGKTRGTAAINHVELCTNQSIAALLPNIKHFNPLFMFHYIDNKYLELRNLSTGDGGRGGLNKQILLNFGVKLTSLDEQKAIASYFQYFDSLIFSTTKKIASLKQVKSASLISMFPQAGETKPRVRFKGFDGGWRSEPLSIFSKKVTKKNQNLEYRITLTNSAEYGIINQLDFFDHDISNGDNIRGYYVVENDDFVYNPRISTLAPVGPINRNMLGYSGVMSPLYYVFKVSGIDKDYLSVFFKTTLWHKFMKDNGNSGARFDRLSITDDVFVQMPIIYPSDEIEQQRIASYFRSLDKQISLQEQRLEKLKQIKSACLDKMFV